VNKNSGKIFLKISILITVLIGISLISYYSMQKTTPRIVKPKEFKPITGDIIVTVKNMVTKDKKYYWMRIKVNWQIDKLTRPIGFEDSKQVKNYVNSYLRGVADSAIILSMLGKSSLDIFGSKRDMEEEIKRKIKERLKSVIIDKEDINITNVSIMRYKYFDEKYEAEDFPPLPNRGNYVKTKPRLIKVTPYPKDSQSKPVAANSNN